MNNMDASDSVVKGQRLVVKSGSKTYRTAASPSGRRLTYTVRRGDTVFSISKQFQVSVTQLKSWNGLNTHHQIRAGQRLVMYVASNRQQG
jgi:membrane-bound lytic murein transglycosylase D